MITFCGNPVTLKNYANDPTIRDACLADEIARLAVNSISRSDLQRLAICNEFTVEYTFHPWHGGMYGDQAIACGLSRVSCLLAFDVGTPKEEAYEVADSYADLLRERALEFSKALQGWWRN